MKDKRIFEPVSIYSLRVETGLTQDQFANMLSVTTATVNRWEKGHVKPTGVGALILELLDGALATQRKNKVSGVVEKLRAVSGDPAAAVRILVKLEDGYDGVSVKTTRKRRDTSGDRSRGVRPRPDRN